VKWQKKALGLAGKEKDVEPARARLVLYEARNPYREEPATK
jgi:hypothetical protein